jgi:hypothetical protein
MGEALIDHLHRILASSKGKQEGGREGGRGGGPNVQQAADVEKLSVQVLLENIWVLRCCDDAELLQTLQHLPAFLEREPEVRGRGGGRGRGQGRGRKGGNEGEEI